MVQDANSLPWTDASASAAQVAVGPNGRCWTAPVDVAQALSAQVGPKALAVEVYANHGRWIVECPDCHSAQLACPDDARFMCDNCANALAGGFWRPVIWPKERDKIEAALHARPITSQHWTPGETAANLRAENKTMGVSA